MQELITIKTGDNQEPVVSGRELHKGLEIKTPYKQWFERMCAYGFEENQDFFTVTQKCAIANNGYQTRTDHILTLDTAKEIAMLQRNEKGKEIRKYFIQVEKYWNSPEKIMERAYIIAKNNLDALTVKYNNLMIENKEMQPKVEYHDKVLNSGNLITTSDIAKDLGMSAIKLNRILYRYRKIIYPQGGNWKLYSKYQDRVPEYADYKITEHNQWLYWTEKGRKWIIEEVSKYEAQLKKEREFQEQNRPVDEV